MFIFLWAYEVVGVYVPLGTLGGWCLYSSRAHEVVSVYIPLGT